MTAAAALLSAVVLAGCGSSGSPGGAATTSPSAGSVVTVAQARQVLSQFTTVNNRANKVRQDSVLGTIESGSSYQIDTGQYRWTQVTDPANHDYTVLSYVSPVFLVPRQSGYPAWFAVRTMQQNATTPSKDQYVYLVFTKASASATWLQVREPGAYGLPAQSQPQVATASGYAVQVSPTDASGLALAPAKIPAADVSYLDVGNIPTTAPRPGLPVPKRPHVTEFVNGTVSLADLSDRSYFHGNMPSGSTQTDTHQTTADPIFALRTTGGGVLVFYDLTASLTLGAPFAQPFTVKIPGIFNGTEHETSFMVNYDEQYAVYEPPGPSAEPQVLANWSGPVSGECDGGPCS